MVDMNDTPPTDGFESQNLRSIAVVIRGLERAAGI